MVCLALRKLSELQKTGAKYVAQTFIMEQYLDGPEVDIDLVLSGGEAVYGGVTDNWPTVEPYASSSDSNLGNYAICCLTAALCCTTRGNLFW